MPPLRLSIATRVFLTLLLFVVQLAPAGAVLCVAGSDHAEIEASGCHSAIDGSTPPSRSLPDDGCPDECRDTPLGDGPAIRSVLSAAGTMIAVLPSVAAWDLARLDRAALERPTGSLLPPDPLATFPSTILRC